MNIWQIISLSPKVGKIVCGFCTILLTLPFEPFPVERSYPKPLLPPKINKLMENARPWLCVYPCVCVCVCQSGWYLCLKARASHAGYCPAVKRGIWEVLIAEFPHCIQVFFFTP